MFLTKNGHAMPFVAEETAHEGVRLVAKKVIEDVEKVGGVKPELLAAVPGIPHVLCATLGCSPAADALIAAGKLPQAEEIRGGWERFVIAGIDGNLVILGSDKRGTEFGMFELSRYIGVSPLVYWGDAEPIRRDEIELKDDLFTVSREPSVKYRGLFINDEWPCFGNWCMEHFGGVNAKMYDHVFELLLRLKANYMWPAMWASVFAEEGPGSLNEELADAYGIVVGNSHHEPCLRAGEEFKHSIQAGGEFGTDWNFVRNREGITRFWAEGLKRSGRYEHLITIGMRGEADSAMLGEDSGLRANIEYLKDVITTQEELIQQYAGPKSKDQPRLLALYKEVEPFFYGSETVQGLKDWEGLRDTVCMLCEDNHGFMRSLPTPEMTASLKERGCGWGMYYHVDYHGGPVSYEWMPSTPFAKLWEQMCLAYDSGIRDVWILNTGDLKGNETSLHQFLDLAWDYDRWGSHDPENWRKWVAYFIGETFPALDEGRRALAEEVLIGLYDMNGRRRPEALNPGIYHPCHEDEAGRMFVLANDLTDQSKWVCQSLTEPALTAWKSLVDMPVRASAALIQMHTSAALNAHYAAQGRPFANFHADEVARLIEKDKALCEEYAAFRDGKWRGMEQEEHIGFTIWNEDGCLLPLRTYVTPWHKPRLSLSRADDARTYGKVYFGPHRIIVNDFCDEGVSRVQLEVHNAGSGLLNFRVEWDEDAAPWLEVDQDDSPVGNDMLACIYLRVDREQLTGETETAVLTVISDDAKVLVEVSARGHEPNEKPAFMPVKQVVTIDAHHFCAKHDAEGAAFRVLPGLGRSGNAVKVYPAMASFAPDGDAPSLTYRFYAETAGEYDCELWLTPTSPVRPGAEMRCGLTGPDGADQVITCIPADYRPGENSDPRWCRAMLDHIRKVKAGIRCEEGLNEITLRAIDPNWSLERILVYPTGRVLPESYLGAKESPCI